MLTGGCHCGEVRYQATGMTFHAGNCHCSICRRTTGAPFVAWFSVQREHFRFTQGNPQRYASSAKATRTFCSHCGTQLTFEHADFAAEVDVTTCSLDDPERAPPEHHIHTSARLGWVKICDGLPEFTEARN